MASGPGGILSVLRPAPITVPEGATLPLVLETAMSSATSRSGDRVVARLAEDVKVGEKVVVPAGSEVRGRVTAAVPSGRVKTRARLAFDFDTLVLEGKEHSIGTRPVDITAGDTHNKDAATIGIGAGAGAIVGAIANGGKGAGIGALIGGAAGTGVVLVNTGKEVAAGQRHPCDRQAHPGDAPVSRRGHPPRGDRKMKRTIRAPSVLLAGALVLCAPLVARGRRPARRRPASTCSAWSRTSRSDVSPRWRPSGSSRC